MIYGFHEKRIATTLKRMAKERLDQPQRAYDYTFPKEISKDSKGYIVAPTERIPAARKIQIGNSIRVLLGTGEACVYRRNQDTGDNRLYLQTDDNGDPVTVTIYNADTSPIDPATPGSNCLIDCDDPLCLVVSDMWGDLYVSKTFQFPSCSSVSSSVSASESGSISDSSVSESSQSEGSEGSVSSFSEASSSSGSSACYTIEGIDFDDLPILDPTEIEYLLAVSLDGCLGRAAISECPTSGSSSSSGS